MSRQAGFTLVETLVALAILAALAALAAGALRKPPASALATAEARQIASVLQRARAEAVSTQTERRFVFDGEQRSYGVEGGRARRLPQEIRLSADLAAGEARQTGVIRFFPSGTTSGGVLRVSAADAVRTVRVNWATGAVVVEEAAP
ncbi:GspH/FimT family protein [Alsobacter sp. R-9]